MVVRWLATANALKRLMLLRESMQSFFNSNDHDFNNQLSPQDWKAVQGILAVIEFGRQISTMLQTETKPTIAIGRLRILLFVKHCRNVKRQPSMNDPNVMEPVVHQTIHPRAKSVASALASDAAKRFSKSAVTSIERLGIMADPRTKVPPAIFVFEDDEVLVTKRAFSKTMHRITKGRRGNASGAQVGAVGAVVGAAAEDVLDPLFAEMAALDEARDEDPIGDDRGGGADGIHPDLAAYLDTVPAVPLRTKDFDPLQYHLQRRSQSEANLFRANHFC